MAEQWVNGWGIFPKCPNFRVRYEKGKGLFASRHPVCTCSCDGRSLDKQFAEARCCKMYKECPYYMRYGVCNSR